MKNQEIVLDAPLTEIDSKLDYIVKREISPSLFITSDSHKLDRNTRLYEIGNCYPKMIWDYEKNLAIYRFLNIYSIGTIRVKKIDSNHTEIKIPSIDKLREKFQEKMGAIHQKSEIVLLQTIHDYLVKIPSVELSMNRIWRILEQIHTHGEINISYNFGYKDYERTQKYIHLLKEIDFIDIKNNKIVPAIELEAIRSLNLTDKKFHQKILSSVLKKGFPFIKDYLHILMIDPFLRLSNSYYLPSHQVNKLLEFGSGEFRESLYEVYNTRKSRSVIENQLTYMTECGIFEKTGNRWAGIEKIFGKFSNELGSAVPSFR